MKGCEIVERGRDGWEEASWLRGGVMVERGHDD
jgi:hypothetical protein